MIPLQATPRTDALPCCPYCRLEVSRGPSCPRCATRYHADCAQALGRCALLGCPGRLAARRLGARPRLACGEQPRRWRLRWGRIAAVAATLTVVGAAALIPNVQEHRKLGNEAAAVGSLKTIALAQSLFREADAERDDLLDYGTLEELAQASLIDALLCGGTRQGYVFEVAPSTSTPEFLWMATATPLEPGTTGDRAFAVNQSGCIVYRDGALPFSLRDDCELPFEESAHACR